MSSQEFQMHLIKVLLLSIELSKEIRILSNFKTNNTQNHTTDYLAWQSAMEKLTTEKVLEYINYILVNYGNILEEREKEAIVINFYNGFYNSQGFIPMSREQIQEALKLNVD